MTSAVSTPVEVLGDRNTHREQLSEQAQFGQLPHTMRPQTITGALFVQPIPVSERFGLINTSELGQQVAACLGPNGAMLLRGHGANVTGASLAEAIVAAIYLEQEALAQWRAQAIGSPSFVSQAELDATGPVAFDPISYERAWHYYLQPCRAQEMLR